MSLITCENLTLGYEGKAILSGLNFSVNSGDYLCIVGENGSGKSTLMKTLLHLQSPMSGSIILGDDLKINEIGYLPQQTALQRDFPASVDEIVMSGFLGRMGLRPFYNKAEKKEAREERNREKLANGDWVMAEFYASWCPHCKRMQPIVEEFKKAMEGTLEVVQVDIDQESALADFYTIEMYPTFILMRKGEQLWRQSGELPLERLEKAVKEYKLKA